MEEIGVHGLERTYQGARKSAIIRGATVNAEYDLAGGADKRPRGGGG